MGDDNDGRVRRNAKKKTAPRSTYEVVDPTDSRSRLLLRALALPSEVEWAEFKHNKDDPTEIGEYVSAIANAAALHGEIEGIIVWGIEDGTMEVIGTTFQPWAKKVNGQELTSWLTIHLHPRIDIRFVEFDADGKTIVALFIPAATHTPVRFNEYEFIRVGSYKNKLRDHPEKHRALWKCFEEYRFEASIALPEVLGSRVLSLLDFPSYYRLTHQPLPSNSQTILNQLASEGLISQSSDGSYDILNLGAILFANDLVAFDRLARKTLRIIIYRGKSRVETIQEYAPVTGYAAGFEDAIGFINSRLPVNEYLGTALRTELPMYPEIAIRELVANAVIHQDFSVVGAGPMVEIFDDRIEITNPGKPLIDTSRFLDLPPQSRNEKLASFMRRMRICEERGSGIDKVFSYIELFQLPAPDFRVVHESTVSVLYAHRTFAEMDKNDRIRACYQHAGLRYVSHERMTNASLRKRLAIEDKHYAVASRVIRTALDAGLIKPSDPENTSRTHASYLPFWG